MLDFLPGDWRDATLVGRVRTPDGPIVVLSRRGRAYDVTRLAPTSSDLVHAGGAVDVRAGIDLGPLDELAMARAWTDTSRAQHLLSPIDLQCIKAAGVTFAVSAVERVIEERAMGDARRADEIRAALRDRVGTDIRSVRPGSPEAAKLKEALLGGGLWSQYMEVAIGPDAEIFSKSQPLSSVGWGEYVGVRSDSSWNNPEPELVVVCDKSGRIRGATLANDVNLRDIEGRSALLLGKSKDNNASCAIGPFVRLFDDGFGIDDVRRAVVTLDVAGEEGFRLEGKSSMREISRDPEELVRQATGEHHYPDGFVLLLGTMFAPVEDRDTRGHGFTHKIGDVVRISSDKLGVLENRVTTCDRAPAWTWGIGELMNNLARRGLLPSPHGAAGAAP